jgi:hypothetical protein
VKQGTLVPGGPVTDLRKFAESEGIVMTSPKDIAVEAAEIQARKTGSASDIKANFDRLVLETEDTVHQVYLNHERKYGVAVLKAFVDHLVETREIKDLKQAGDGISKHFKLLDGFYLSLANGRKSRAGSAFENIHNSLFKKLGYPFEEQVMINGSRTSSCLRQGTSGRTLRTASSSQPRGRSVRDGGRL